MGCGASRPRASHVYGADHARPVQQSSPTAKHPQVSYQPSQVRNRSPSPPRRRSNPSPPISNHAFSPFESHAASTRLSELEATPSPPRHRTPSSQAALSTPSPPPTNYARSRAPHPTPPTSTRAPPCRECGHALSIRKNCKTPNPNGNAGRPQYVCGASDCGEFICFDDIRGVHGGNPTCYCGNSSRAILMASRGSFYRCASGFCGFRADGPRSNLKRGPISVEEAVRAGF